MVWESKGDELSLDREMILLEAFLCSKSHYSFVLRNAFEDKMGCHSYTVKTSDATLPINANLKSCIEATNWIMQTPKYLPILPQKAQSCILHK